MTDLERKEIENWISIGWEYRIIHKMSKLKLGYDITKNEVNKIKEEMDKEKEREK